MIENKERDHHDIIFDEKWLKINILPTHISFICCDDYGRIVDLIGNRVDGEFYMMVGMHDDYICESKGKKIIRNNVVSVFTRVENLKKYTVGEIAHEAVHVVDFIYGHIGEESSVETSEMYAYMVGYITDKLYKFIKKCSKKYGN